jgi:hypothetical protein
MPINGKGSDMNWFERVFSKHKKVFLLVKKTLVDTSLIETEMTVYEHDLPEVLQKIREDETISSATVYREIDFHDKSFVRSPSEDMVTIASMVPVSSMVTR